MSLSDIFGEFPGRPEHEDFRVLVDIVLAHDGKSEDADLDMKTFFAGYIDPESLEYMAQGRAKHFMARMGRNPALNAQLVAMLTAMFLDAFTIGADWQKRQPTTD